MAFAWIFVLVAMMAGTKAGNKLKRAKSKRDKASFSEQDYELPESEVSIDWEALANEDDDEIEGTAVKEEQPTRSRSPIRKYTRRRSARNRGVRINEPLVSTQPGHRESTWIEGRPAPSQPSTTHEKETSQNTATLSSIRSEQQRLSAEQAKLANDFKLISAELRNMKKKHNSISKLVRKICSKMGCSSSKNSDSN